MDLMQVIQDQYDSTRKEVHHCGIFTMAIIYAKKGSKSFIGVGFAKKKGSQISRPEKGESVAVSRAIADLVSTSGDGETTTEMPETFLQTKAFSSTTYERHSRGSFVGVKITAQTSVDSDVFVGIGIAARKFRNQPEQTDVVRSVAERRAIESLFRSFEENSKES